MGNSFNSPASSGGGGGEGSGGPLVLTSSTYPFTSAAEMDRLYSSIGVDLRCDDGNESVIIDEIIDQATETIASYTLSHYDSAELANSAYIRRRATVLACYYLSMRRADAPQFVGEAKRVLEDLELIRTNKIIVPDAIVRAADVPAISSWQIDDRYYTRKQRVVTTRSTQPYPGQDKYELPYAGGGDIF